MLTFQPRHYTLHIDPTVPYDYYYRVFYKEFAHKLGFEPPKTDCCNTCVIYDARLKGARWNQNQVLAIQLVAEHQAHLELAGKHCDDMNWDFGGKDVEDILLTHTVTEYDALGQVIHEPIVDYIFFCLYYL